MLRHSGGRPPDTRRVRLLALVGFVAAVIALPLAVASWCSSSTRGVSSSPPGTERRTAGHSTLSS
ncbi:hypothetical protein ABZS63_22050, partial [Streptomyces sp. NPDC005568]